jgi:1-acyl-sn-glycerol-3-phosphate acyltransferase
VTPEAITPVTTAAPPARAEAPGAEAQGAEAPGAEAPGAEAPGAEVPGAEAPAAEVPGAEAPGVEVPGAEVPGDEATTEPPASVAPESPTRARPSRAAIRAKRRGAGTGESTRLHAVPPVGDAPLSATGEGEATARHTGDEHGLLGDGNTPPSPDGDGDPAHSTPERLVGAVLEAAEFSSESRPGPAELVELAINVIRAAATSAGVPTEDVERQVAETLAYLRRRLSGDYVVDEFGFDEDYTIHVHLPLLRPLYRRWFRVEVRGIENIPTVGGALVVGNHSGTVAMDSLMTQVAVYDEHPANRHLRMLGADLVFQMPFVGTMARRSGSTLAANTDAERLLRSGELVGVWPEGFKGVGKPFSERYKLQRFGRGGFVSAALRAGAPIVPVSIVGAEEIYPMIGNMPAIARLLGVPYAPITPTFPWLGPLGVIPLPSKWLIEFGPPIETTSFGVEAADDPMLVFDLTDQVRETIQQTLYSLLMQRKSVFL